MIHYHIIDPVIYLWNLCPLSVSIFSGREKWVRARNFEGRETEGRTMTHVHGQGENHVVDGVCRSYETGLLPLRVIGIQSPSFPPSMIHASRNPYNPTCFQHFSNFYTLILETRHFQLRNFDLDFDSYWNFDRKLESCIILFEETIQETILQQNENRGGRRRVGGGSGRAKP